jgi:CBS domain containing-hemolysin-like protein
MNNGWTWMFLGSWLLLSFFLSGMEAGVQSLSRLRLRQWKRQGHVGAEKLLAYLENSENFLWTVLVGNTLASLAAVAMLVFELKNWFGDNPLAFWSGIIGVWLLLYIFCDLLPKTLFRRYPNRLCLHLLIPFRIVHAILTPFVAVAEWFANLLLRWTGGKRFTGHLFGNREEVLAVMRESGAALSSQERALIDRVTTLQNTSVSRLARSLNATPSVQETAPVTEVLDLCRRHHVTRVPVWRTHESTPRIIGVATLRDLLYGNVEVSDPVGRHMRPALFLNDTLRVESALRQMQRSGHHLAILLGTDGRECGVLILWDILHQIFEEPTN